MTTAITILKVFEITLQNTNFWFDNIFFQNRYFHLLSRNSGFVFLTFYK